MNRRIELYVGLATLPVCLLLTAIAGAAWKDDVGYTTLSDELGGLLPRGSNIPVCQVEAPYGVSEYMPNTNNAEFGGKTFRNMSGSNTGASDHATTVALTLYGTNTGIVPGVTQINNYLVSHWAGVGSLNSGTANAPSNETCRVQNQSCISLTPNTNALRRLDYAVDRDGFVAVVGLNNIQDSIPALMAHAYNIICVGRSDGIHSTGKTTFDDAGRIKPDIVAPLGSVSEAVPAVAGAAAIIVEKAASDSSLSDAGRPQAVKAILLAGATKDEFPSWDRTQARPLDDVYGAGELNIRNSYGILASGRQAASTTNLATRSGWDFVSIPQGTSAWWFIEVPESNVLTRLSIALVWHRRITSTPASPFVPVPFVPNFDLHLHTATNFDAGPVFDSSTSMVDNVEHIYQRYLPAGRYAMEVRSINLTTNCSLAWYSRTSVIPPITNISVTATGVQFSAAASPGVPYAIEATTNLLEAGSWVRVATNAPVTNTFTYTETNTLEFIKRFYRMVPDP